MTTAPTAEVTGPTIEPFRVRLDVPLTESFLRGVLETACYGAISYWIDVCDAIKRDDEGYAYEVTNITPVEGHEGPERWQSPDDETWHSHDPDEPCTVVCGPPHHGLTITTATVALGIQRLLDGTISVNDSIRSAILTDVLDEAADPGNGGGMIDAWAADAVVQAGLFGEVVFG